MAAEGHMESGTGAHFPGRCAHSGDYSDLWISRKFEGIGEFN